MTKSRDTDSQPRQWVIDLVEDLSRHKKQLIAVVSDAVMLPVALWTAMALRLGEWTPEIRQFWPAFVVSALVCLPVFGGLGLYRQVVRYMGNHAMLAVVKGATITAIAVAAVAYMVPLRGFPRSVPIIFWILTLMYVSGTRFAVRGYFNWLSQRQRSRTPVIIYGAGRNGVELAGNLFRQGDRIPVAFLDDDRRMHRRTINGVYVHQPSELGELLLDTQAREVLVAVPSTALAERKRIIEFLEPFAVHVRLIPDLADLVTGQQHVLNLRDVQVEDLLGRDAVNPLDHLLAGSVRGEAVLVTGAAGSIGSELCRQIARLEPRLLVLLDQNEYGLYEIHRELLVRDLQVVAVLGSVLDRACMLRTMSSYHIDTVYHAAAYKHVGLVENNVIQGLKNNTFGTLHTAESALEAGVKRFILISTDKAVRTTNVMGASKRLAEMVLQALQDNSDQTRFSMVRFGNVLGSSGSVVPLFLEQIERGGPVTVTHPDATRYFMTIPEAAQLVLQAASMAKGGDVFLLDMGAPVRIMDLARRMIRLKGFTLRGPGDSEGDIEIRISGLAPGEKVHEELLIADAATGTEHRKILRAEEDYVKWSELRGALNTLEQACDAFDYEAIKTFIERVVEGADLNEQLIELAEPVRANVVPLTHGTPE
ncbi:MAG: polysaccharide biosynthesis protein [Gammaproteobacteria bacterium]|nr:MAG: polysaccharide biosynthesis protein [Gammaproteobacteria bacterium]TDJ38807.1 MAG: polysaccharide biosynthesis protein [Gammaproteobacteria bacterium]